NHDSNKVKHQQFVGANVSLNLGHFQKCLTVFYKNAFLFMIIQIVKHILYYFLYNDILMTNSQ
ncbi:hypothetical protein, partial [Clostridium estertheticum]|uniref:hypothetical protein n=1 Tax=Clostridium estertheticum TaxID=238834 RepID=UPI001C6EC82B